MRELFWAWTEMGALKKTTLVAKLCEEKGVKMAEYARGRPKDTYDFTRGEVGTSPS